jgi:threonine dehydrogenase-like Zn-dependent dehydrogenase
VVEPNPHRAERAHQMGAYAVLDPTDPQVLDQIKQLTDGRGADCALDCSGKVEAERLCIDATRRKGKVSFVGECMDDLAIRISPDLIRKGLTLIGAWHYNLGEFPAVMQVIQRSPLIERLVSHVFPLSQVQDAFECSTSQESAKIIFQPWA